MSKILLALQFWKGDARQAERLADFIAALQPSHSDQADFLLASRFDCPQGTALSSRLSKKFNVYQISSERKGIGWPIGCNQLWLGTVEWVLRMQRAKKIPLYSGVFTFEADCVPLTRDWIPNLKSHWERAVEQRNGKLAVMGAWLPNGPAGTTCGHINGNCMVSCAMLDKIVAATAKHTSRMGWDFCMGPWFERMGWAKMPGQKCHWRSRDYTQEQYDKMVAEDVFFVHGCKDDSLLNLAKKALL